MKVIAPDFDHVVDLPGAGPTARPVDIDADVTGFRDLASFRIHELADGARIEEGSDGDEALVVLLAGVVSISVAGDHEARFRLDADGDWALYLPPGHLCRLEALAPSAIACARARSSAVAAPRAFCPVGGILAIDEPAQRLRLRLLPLEGETDASAGLGSDLERLAHLTGPATLLGGATRDLPPAHTLALAPGEGARVTGDGELLALAALPPATT